MMLFVVLGFMILASFAEAGTVLWDGRFDLSADAKYKTTFSSKVYSSMSSWSFSNAIGPYEYYIPAENSATNPISELIQLSPDFKNPADKVSGQGVKITLTTKRSLNHQWRTELIPHTYDGNFSKSEAISKGLVFYHFSMMRKDVNPPSTKQDHQVCYFENGHFIEMRYGLLAGTQGTEGLDLHVFIDGKSKWSRKWEPLVWHNIAYEIDFTNNLIAFWHSTGSNPLVKEVEPIKAATSSNGRDWHLGALKLPKAGTSPEDWYFSGVYIEAAPLTKEMTGPTFTCQARPGKSCPAAKAVRSTRL